MQKVDEGNGLSNNSNNDVITIYGDRASFRIFIPEIKLRDLTGKIKDSNKAPT